MAAVELRPGPEEAESIWIKCASCQEILFRKEVERRLFVCPKCNAHLRLTVEQRLFTIIDRGSFTEHDATLQSNDPLIAVMLHTFAVNIESESILFHDRLITAHSPPGVVFRAATSAR